MRSADKYYAKPWISKQARMQAVKEYLSGTPAKVLAGRVGVHFTTIYNWTQGLYKQARNGVTIVPHLRKRYGVKTTRKTTKRGTKTLVTATNNIIPHNMISPSSLGRDEDIIPAGLKDLKVTGNFEFVDGKAFATDIVVNITPLTKFKLTKDTLKLLTDLGDKLL